MPPIIMMNSFTLLVALATVVSVCEGTVDISGIVIRQANTSTAGGFATRATTCSTTQVDCGGGVTQEICCPSNTFCFNSDDGVCCPTDGVDCTTQVFAAPQCADPTWFLCTDYQPNIPGYVPNDPGYWCCPTNTQCLVSPEAGFVCSTVNDGDTPGSTVLSGQAPTQASTATTAPTLSGSATSASGTKNSSPITLSSPGTSSSSHAASSSPTSYATKTSSSSLGILVAQALFALTLGALL